MKTPTPKKRQLPNDVEALKAIISLRDEEIEQLDEEIEKHKRRIAQLENFAFGKKSEKRKREDLSDLVLGQGHLFHLDLIAEAERTAKEKQVQGDIILTPPKRSAPRKGRKSRRPDHCPRISTRYELEDDACKCKGCGGALHEIGEEITEELERVETIVVHEIRRVKYGCRHCECGVVTSPGPDRVIDKGLLGPGFLGSVAVERFANHMPYNRLEKKYAMEGVDLSRSVLERSMSRIASILEPIANQLRKEVLAEPAIFNDDTPVTIARPRGSPGSSKGRVWIYLDRQGRHSYDFTEDRKGKWPQEVLKEYFGFIHADAFPGLDSLFGPEGATEVACWAHTRRKFIDAETSEPELAKEALARIGELYLVEREAKRLDLDAAARFELRQRKSIPIANELFAWMAKTEAEVLAKGPMAGALRYALKLEGAPREYLNDGRLSIDNNAAERALRAVAIGRKNWLFFQREGGGRTAVIMLSLIMTAKAAGVNPQTYLRDVLLRIARETDVTKLTPHGWKEHFQAEVAAERQSVQARFLGQKMP